MGNWQERIDELESENFDLLEENRRLDDEVTDLLYEIDTLKDKLSEAQEERYRLDKQLNQVAHESYLDWSRAEQAEDRINTLKRELCARADNLMDQLDATVTERDHLRAKKTELELDVEALLALVEYWQEKAAEAAEGVQYWEESSREDSEDFYTLMGDLDAVQERANSWFEVAKKLVRSRNVWMRAANRDLELRYQVEKELSELKKALRTLSQ